MIKDKADRENPQPLRPGINNYSILKWVRSLNKTTKGCLICKNWSILPTYSIQKFSFLTYTVHSSRSIKAWKLPRQCLRDKSLTQCYSMMFQTIQFKKKKEQHCSQPNLKTRFDYGCFWQIILLAD